MGMGEWVREKWGMLALAAIAVVAVGVAVTVVVRFRVDNRRYVAVYLSSGEMYFGELKKFPRLALTRVHMLQQTNDKEKPFALQKLAGVFWEPEDALLLNDEQIVWMATLRRDGQVARYIAGEQGNQQPAAAPSAK